jgi:hypothetical protein
MVVNFSKKDLLRWSKTHKVQITLVKRTLNPQIPITMDEQWICSIPDMTPMSDSENEGDFVEEDVA